MQFPGFCIPDDGKQVSPHATTGWLHQSQCSVCCDGSIDGAAPSPQNVHGNLRGQRLAGSHHTMLRNHFASGPESPSGQAILGAEERGHTRQNH